MQNGQLELMRVYSVAECKSTRAITCDPEADVEKGNLFSEHGFRIRFLKLLILFLGLYLYMSIQVIRCTQ